MPQDRLQLQRFELKYLITEDIALKVRDFVSSYLEIDEYGATQKNLSYPIHSLYLDTDDLKYYRSTINGTKNRYKLRLRFYENRPNAPVYFEIKRRMNNAIMKQRGPVRREAVELIINGHLPGAEDILSKDPKHIVAVERFRELMLHDRASPKSHVAYYREAWISQMNNSIRVTLDREVRCEPEHTVKLSPEIKNPIYPFGNKVVLEIKFTGRYPDWFKDLVRIFGLTQCAASKYVDGIVVGGENKFAPGSVKDFETIKEKVILRKAKLERYLSATTIIKDDVK